MRAIHEVAAEIKQDWKKVYFGAVPYLEAMGCLTTIDEPYYAEDAKTVVLYFLANANTWRGETARRVKQELKEMVGVK